MRNDEFIPLREKGKMKLSLLCSRILVVLLFSGWIFLGWISAHSEGTLIEMQDFNLSLRETFNRHQDDRRLIINHDVPLVSRVGQLALSRLGLKGEDLFWRMNGAGFFNHFFDMKYVLPFTRNYSRMVFVEPLRSNHYDTDIVLCDYVNLPGLKCLRRGSSIVKCSNSFQKSIDLIRLNQSNICFAEAAFNRTNLNRQRFHIYLAPEPRLVFQPLYVNFFEQILTIVQKDWPKTFYTPRFFSVLNSTKPIIPPSERYAQHNFGENFPMHLFADNHRKYQPFIVVHWRRGDQLDTRCDNRFAGLVDTSPNCATIEELLIHLHHERIRFPPETQFFIATNERNATILRILRRHQYIILNDVLRSFRYENLNISSFSPNATILNDYNYFNALSAKEMQFEQESFKKRLLEVIYEKEAEKRLKTRNELPDDKTKIAFKPKMYKQSPNQNRKKKVKTQLLSEQKRFGPVDNDETSQRILLDHKGVKKAPGSIVVSTVVGYGSRGGQTHPHSMGRLTAMDGFTLESLFMLRATVLINYGISTIHDAIESERYLSTILNINTKDDKKDVSVCYMAQDPFSWCGALQKEVEYERFTSQNSNSQKSHSFNLLPAYPNSALVLPEENLK